MTTHLISMVRYGAYSALALCGVAVGLGRMEPRPALFRTPAEGPPVAINGYQFNQKLARPRFLDPDSGTFSQVPLPEQDRLEYASCSPWRDERGQAQVVGRWSKRASEWSPAVGGVFGLARYRYPSGEVLDRVPTEIVPVCPPCWYPGTTARVLFAAGDGQLYQFAFEGSGDREGAYGGEHDDRPRPLSWRCDPPGDGPITVTDVAWPTGPEWGHRILVSLSYQRVEGGRRQYTTPQLWWLQIGAGGTTVEAAGPLSAPSPSGEGPGEGEIEQRFPTPGRSPEGRPVLAFVGRRPSSLLGSVRLAPVRFDPEGGTPSIDPSAMAIVAEGSPALPPVFSADGRWLSCFVRAAAATSPVALRRIPVGKGPGGGARDEAYAATPSDPTF
jgi:hypothetical protein